MHGKALADGIYPLTNTEKVLKELAENPRAGAQALGVKVGACAILGPIGYGAKPKVVEPVSHGNECRKSETGKTNMEIPGIKEITEENAVDLIKRAAHAGVGIWIAGGWGVDALLGYQTRPHNDFDLFVQKKDKIAITGILESCGYAENKEYDFEDNPIWCNTLKGIVDLHLFESVEPGSWSMQNQTCPSDIFSGQGTIGGIPVRCLTAEAQVEYRHGYELREKDKHDVLLLCDVFGLPIPDSFK